jgi:glycosyltransferase involved in cell wall biosynthesis
VSPAVSLIMPCYNAGLFLKEAIDSVAHQSFTDYELLIVDDGSTDPTTLEILGTPGPRARVLRGPRRGVTLARNHALAEAKGRYLSFFDSDDRLEPSFLDRLTRALDADSSCSFAFSWVHVFGEEDWIWRPDRADLDWLLHDCSVPTFALVRREAVLSIGGYDPAMELGHEDWDLWISLAESGHRGLIIPETLFHYRRRTGSRSSTADYGDTYLQLYRERIRKHRRAYGERLFEVLAIKEVSIEHELRSLAEARRHVAEDLLPAARRQREELRRLRAELIERCRGLGPRGAC